ncbi:DUF1186 domain-containing protein [Aestuariivirga sp.]|uniref:DUF1186 domain-containing protein n=1 Tax=Aestuariivirga sp. TaxID=2650926 RepID=UPI0025C2ED6B|nr:DUF1186 domain-containing protein [Aestuariivirga sp.]MCA3554569.1 DUF1186 domain-containing protein [Aestuariivirga sp.]
MTPQDVLQAFHTARGLPLAAMQAALANREEMLPAFLQEFGRASHMPLEQLPYSNAYGVMFEILGQWADARSYVPLVTFLRLDEETLEELLGDCLSEIGSRVLAGVATHDLTPLRDLVLDPNAYVFARSEAIIALSRMGIARHDRRVDVIALIREIGPKFEPGVDDIVVSEWAAAVAIFGIEDQVAQARAVVDAIPRQLSPLAPEEFEELLRQSPDELSHSGVARSYVGPQGVDAIADVSEWYWYSDDDIAARRGAWLEDQLALNAPPASAVNPNRHVGRNDPCPCGSGKKFKKCCLG